MTSEEAKQFVEQVRREKLDKDSLDLRAALKLLAEELNTKETHFILELLQNAEDNEYSGKQPELAEGAGAGLRQGASALQQARLSRRLATDKRLVRVWRRAPQETLVAHEQGLRVTANRVLGHARVP
jgi:hypothetical protein